MLSGLVVVIKALKLNYKIKINKNKITNSKRFYFNNFPIISFTFPNKAGVVPS